MGYGNRYGNNASRKYVAEIMLLILNYKDYAGNLAVAV